MSGRLPLPVPIEALPDRSGQEGEEDFLDMLDMEEGDEEVRWQCVAAGPTHGRGSKPMGSHFPILVGIGMFTGGTGF